MKGLHASPPKGSPPKTARPFSPVRRLAMAVWGLWEAAFVRFNRLYEVPGDERHIIRVGFRRWKGPEVELSDGSVVHRGDWVGEIHLNNARFARVWEEAGGSPAAAVARLSGEMRRALQGLADEYRAGRLPRAVVAFFGKTVLDRGMGRMGFEVKPLAPTWQHRWLARYTRWLLTLYHPRGAAYVEDKQELRVLWLGAGELVRRFGSRKRSATSSPSRPAARRRAQAPAAARPVPQREPTAGPT